MKLGLQRQDWAALIVFVLLLGFAGAAYVTYPRTHRQPQDYTLPNDEFDAGTIQQIWQNYVNEKVFDQPLNFEVYMLTGGIGVANPSVLGDDIFQNRDNANVIQIHETTKFIGLPVSEFTEHSTHSGQTYWKLNDPSQAPQYFFNIANTGIQVILETTMKSDYSFPESIMDHLIPIGNPVNSAN